MNGVSLGLCLSVRFLMGKGKRGRKRKNEKEKKRRKGKERKKKKEEKPILSAVGGLSQSFHHG